MRCEGGEVVKGFVCDEDNHELSFEGSLIRELGTTQADEFWIYLSSLMILMDMP